MEPVLTPVEMAEADRQAIAGGTPAEELMDRAGRAVAWQARRMLGGTYGRRVAIVCGKGNNGGDGLVAARVLLGWGVRVEVLELAAGVDGGAVERALQRVDLFVDAMYGTGFSGVLDGAAARAAELSHDVATIAVDIPSGVDGLTGRTGGAAVRADATVTFAARKPGVCFEPGRSLAGDVNVIDIGIDVGPPSLGIVERSDCASWLVPRAPDANKWSAGLLVVGGSGGMTGAPLFVSHAAMRAGAGIVWCGIPGLEAATRAGGSEVVVKPLPADDAGSLTAIPDDFRGAFRRFRAAAVGPGLGTADATRAVVRQLVQQITVPLVLDADGLNAFASDAAALRSRPAPTVITPHAGEYARLVGEPVGDDRVDAAHRLAEASGCVALLKGPGTVVADPDGRAATTVLGGAELATAGSGDVLTGIIGGFLARGLEPFAAAAVAAYVHGRAADRAGHTGMIAGDLVDALPRALGDLEDRTEQEGGGRNAERHARP